MGSFVSYDTRTSYIEEAEFATTRLRDLLIPALPLPYRVAFELVSKAYGVNYTKHTRQSKFINYLMPLVVDHRIFIDKENYVVKKYGHKNDPYDDAKIAALTLYLTRYYDNDKLRTVYYSKEQPVILSFVADIKSIGARMESIPYEIMAADVGQEYKVYNRINNNGRDVVNIVYAHSDAQCEEYVNSLVKGTIIVTDKKPCLAFTLPEYNLIKL